MLEEGQVGLEGTLQAGQGGTHQATEEDQAE